MIKSTHILYKKAITYLLLPILLIEFSCASSNIKRFPDFSSKSNEISQISLILDSVIVIETDNKLKMVDLYSIKPFTTTILRELNESFHKKGYIISESYKFIGLTQVRDKQYYIKNDKKTQNLKKLEIGNAPFYIDPKSDNDDFFLGYLSRFLITLNNLPAKKEGGKNYKLNLDKRFLNNFSTTNIATFQIHSYIVPVWKSILIGVLVGLLTLGMVSVYPMSSGKVQFNLINTQTGEIIWEDSWYISLDTSELTDKIAKIIVSHFMNRLPAKI